MDKFISFYSSLFHEDMNDQQRKVFHMLMREYSGVLCQPENIKFDTRNSAEVVIVTKNLNVCSLYGGIDEFTDILFAADFNLYRCPITLGDGTQLNEQPSFACERLRKRIEECLKPDFYDSPHSTEEILNHNFNNIDTELKDRTFE